MHNKQHFQNSFFSTITRAATDVLALVIVLALALMFAQSAQAQTYTVIHNFTGGADGTQPQAGLTMDAAGHFCGTTINTVYGLKRSGSGWVVTTLTSEYGPGGRVAIASDGTLYGAITGNLEWDCWNGYYCGAVYHLRPWPAAPRSVLAPWNGTLVYSFTGSLDGGNPEGDLTFDQAGNIYGTTFFGGMYYEGYGVIYELTPAGGDWTETVLYAAQNEGDGRYPMDGVVFDTSGNLYGVFQAGGLNSGGAVYQLSPSGSGWTEQTVHGFNGIDGSVPYAGLIIDHSGNLYGTTLFGGSGGAGTVYELTPTNGGWTFNTLYNFYGNHGPTSKLALDAAGNLYGTTNADGAYGEGSVFKLTPSNGGWTYTSLHDFTGGADGAGPNGPVLDPNGNLYGTAALGGTNNLGVVWEITP